MRITHRSALAAALACALVPAAGAQAATKKVGVGLAKPPKLPAGALFNAYFPDTTSVHVGDTVQYEFYGFANVLFGRAPLTVPGDTIAGVKDPAGGDLWFNGQKGFNVNPDVLFPIGKGVVGKPKGLVGSGIPLDDKPKPFKVKFNKPGTYTYRDTLHPGVTGKVVVKPKGARITTAAQDKSRVAKQVSKMTKDAKRLDTATPAANTIQLGSDTKNVAFFRFFPAAPSVKVNTPVDVAIASQSAESHNLVVGPDDFLQKNGSPFNVTENPAGPPTFSINPLVFFPSQPPTGPTVFDGTQNGGFVNTGVLDNDAASPLPAKTQLTFTKAGTYKVFCTLHAPDMNATVTVTE